MCADSERGLEHRALYRDPPRLVTPNDDPDVTTRKPDLMIRRKQCL